MRLSKITYKNFRCFNDVTLSLDERLTLLVGKNGSGKSAALDGIRVAVGAWSSELDAEKSSIDKNDARRICYDLGSGTDVQSQYPVSVESEGHIYDEECEWTRILATAKGRTRLKGKTRFNTIAQTVKKRISAGDPKLILPLVSYYGTGRLWAQKRKKQDEVWTKTSRLNGYLDSLDAAANDKLMLQWFRKMSLKSEQQKQAIPEYQAVCRAMEDCVCSLTGSHEAHVEFDFDLLEISVRYKENESEKKFPLSMLSDGYKSTISLIADIAYRMASLNPQLMDDVLKLTPGIVIIDEVDLHLHPAWQHRILDDLLNIFPKVQFVVSTHSPGIMSSAKQGKIIMIAEGEVIDESVTPYGSDANSIMSSIMGISSRPEEVAGKFVEFNALLDKADYAAAKCLLDELEEKLGSSDAELSACRVRLEIEQLS